VPGTDLREGVHTLPVLYALQETGPDADRLRVLLSLPMYPELAGADVERTVAALRVAADAGID